MNWSIFKKKKVWVTIVVAVIILIVVLPVALYIYNPSAKLTQSIFKVLPYPVAVIDGKDIITTRTLIADTDALKHFYETKDFASIGMRVDFSTDEGQIRVKIKERDVLDKLIEDALVKKASQDRGINVSEKGVADKLTSLANEEGGLNIFEQELKNLYGWDLDQFQEKVVYSQLYLEKLIDYYSTEEKKNSNEWERIQEAQENLNKDGSNFCEITKNYSDGESAENCGDVDWYERAYIESEISDVIAKMKTGDISDIIKSSLGYHIILLEDTRETKEGSRTIVEVKLKQIFITDGGFVEWISKEKSKHRVWILMKDYKWNSSKSTVEFRDERLVKTEKYLRTKSEGDPIFY